MQLQERHVRHERLKSLIKERILVLDGAMGTALQVLDLKPDDFGGESFEGCNEVLNVTRPQVIEKVLEDYLIVGADIVETNTFGSTDLVLADYPPLNEKAFEITRAGAEIARKVADRYSTKEKPRFVAGSMGPTTKSISVTGGVTFDRLIDTFCGQAKALVQGGVDYLLIETAQDTRNIKSALIGIERCFAEIGTRVPIAVSVTIEPMGTMLVGQDTESLLVSLEHMDLLYVGLNCATGPEFMTDHLRQLAENAPWPVACVPNAGLPDEDGRYVETPAMMSQALGRFIDLGWINLIGGCCGTTPAHIKAFADLAKDRVPRTPKRRSGTFVSGIEALEISDEKRPIIVGERTNVIGSRLFKELIVNEKFDEAAEVARRQVRSGAHIIDICLANPDRDELWDMESFLKEVVNKVKVPLMIDSTDAQVIERALTYSQGKAIINSINLEDGEERFEQVVPMAMRFGAAFVVGTIDEDKHQGMAVTRERKLEIAQRSFDLLTNKYKVAPGDIIFDPLVFPCATGDQQYVGSAVETIEGIRLIKAALPDCKTILGISNVSFGLPPAGREVLNSVFLYHCTLAGLDMAIVNSEKLERYASIPAEERALAEKLLFDPTDEHIAAFTAHFRIATRKSTQPVDTLPLDERLKNYVITGSKDGLIADLEMKLKESKPLAIINGPLMAGMDEVGRLFAANELIVAEVLQSAEVMKAAVNFLEPLMEKADTAAKGKVILATVKGDVHDIGKNLVEIVLANNGYDVINLGIKVPPTDLVRAIKEHRPDIVGLSGLLVKSAQQMVVTAEDLTAALGPLGEAPPMLVGGAALTNSFTRRRIAPAYANMVAYAEDAMKGLELANRIIDPEKRETLIKELEEATAALGAERSAKAVVDPGTTRSSNVPVLTDVPSPPDLSRHILKGLNLDEVWAYINPAMLYSRHLGLRGGRAEQLLAQGDEKALMLKSVIDELKDVCRRGGMQVNAVWQFFKAYGDGNRLVLLSGDAEEPIGHFDFPRQPRQNGLCLSDYVNPRGVLPLDTVCLFAVTAGHGIRELYEEYKAQGEFLKSHAIQALALESAEGAAEWLHARIRGWWGFADSPDMSMRDRFQTRYRGRRYSFGYPACPDLALQQPLFQLINPQEIGIELTDEFMMEPEASVTAIVFHHPACEYYSTLS